MKKLCPLVSLIKKPQKTNRTANTVHTFSPYASVAQDQAKKLGGSIGTESTDTWKFLTFETRKVDYAKLADFLKEHPGANSAKIHDFLRSVGSRQLQEPHLEQMTMPCTLHIGLLSWKDWLGDLIFKFINEDFIAFLRLDSRHEEYRRLVSAHPFYAVVEILKKKLHMSRVAKLLKSLWMNKADYMPFRLNGRETQALSQNFPLLTQKLQQILIAFRMTRTGKECPQSDFQKIANRIKYFHFAALQLRKICALMNRTVMTEEELHELQSICYLFFAVAVKFRSAKYFHRNHWTVGYVVPAFAKLVYQQFNRAGLGLFSLQGREHFHQIINDGLRTTSFAEKWTQVIY